MLFAAIPFTIPFRQPANENFFCYPKILQRKISQGKI